MLSTQSHNNHHHGHRHLQDQRDGQLAGRVEVQRRLYALCGKSKNRMTFSKFDGQNRSSNCQCLSVSETPV